MADTVYWIWFQLVFGIGTRRSELMLRQFGGPQPIAEGMDQPAVREMLAPREASCAVTAMRDAETIKRRTLKKGCAIITPDDDLYPPLLHNVHAKPAALYVKGDLSCLRDRLCIAVVGTRMPSNSGKKVADQITYALAGAGAVIVSGLANGIDSISHQAALDAGSKTIGVLACGIDVDYPRGSAALKGQVSSNGAVMSEFPLGERALAHHFSVRNRILSGMAHGVLVVEAGEKSGALITARHAADQGRDVFAAPGRITDKGYEGSNALIRDGARFVLGAADILAEYKHMIKIPEEMHNSALTRPNNNIDQDACHEKSDLQRKEAPVYLSDPARARYEKVAAQPVSVEHLADSAGMEINHVLAALTELEIYGLVAMYPGRMFALQA
ncbi:MAG: DNA-processing protein DprA [Oscillospiraceae bacterium]|jgi:DNA processing protein|nr:DNA-processing protein DprA [Oscillospiraceae bacterium]